MDDNRFVNDVPLKLVLGLPAGASIGFLLGAFFFGLGGAILGALLGPMVAWRVLSIRPRLQQSRMIDAAAHPTEQARALASPDAYTPSRDE